MIQLNDKEQSTIDASKIVDVKMRELNNEMLLRYNYRITIDCILDDKRLLTFFYSSKEALHADYQKLLMISALNNQISLLETDDAR